jgi:hypothetical protein
MERDKGRLHASYRRRVSQIWTISHRLYRHYYHWITTTLHESSTYRLFQQQRIVLPPPLEDFCVKIPRCNGPRWLPSKDSRASSASSRTMRCPSAARSAGSKQVEAKDSRRRRERRESESTPASGSSLNFFERTSSGLHQRTGGSLSRPFASSNIYLLLVVDRGQNTGTGSLNFHQPRRVSGPVRWPEGIFRSAIPRMITITQ